MNARLTQNIKNNLTSVLIDNFRSSINPIIKNKEPK
jgi:hypothetical protein